MRTLALDWLETLAPCTCTDLIASKQQSFSLWQLNSSDIFKKSKFSIPNFQINVNFYIFFFFLLHYCDVVCRGITGRKYQEGNVRRGKDFEADVSNISVWI